MVCSYRLSLYASAIFLVGVNGQRFLIIPDNPNKCNNRPKHWLWPPGEPYSVGYGDGTQDNNGTRHHYFYSNDVRDFKGKKYDWLDARNLCRQYCMDAVSIETYRENQMIYSFMDQRGVGSSTHFNDRWRDDKKCGPGFPVPETGLPAQCNPASDYHCCNSNGDCRTNEYYYDCGCLDCVDYKEPIKYFWTSGRLCDFSGCESRSDLLPLPVNGWFWSGSNVAIPPTDKINLNWSYKPWSHTGHTDDPQPDNAELLVNGTPESCLAVSKNLYEDGTHWHDIACYHSKPVICEDSDELLNYINSTSTSYDQ